MAVDATEMLLGEHPCGSDPPLHHVRVAPARHVVRAALDPALWAFDNVGGCQAFVERFGNLRRCRVNISFMPSRRLRAALS